MRAYFCVIFTQLFGNSNYYPYFCVKITHKMKDLKYYKEIFCSSELELYFMEENGSCSFVKRKYDYIYRYEEAIVATNALMPLVDYPSSDDSLTIIDRVAFLFGTSDGYFRFTNLCETNKIDIKEIEW